MKKDSLLALALLILVALGCEPSSTINSGRDNRPTAQPAGNARDDGPVSVSGPDRPDYGPTRHPAENAHDYTLRQQGQIGPCGRAWDYMYASYFEWKNGRMTEGQYRDAERGYNECVARNYR